MSVWPPWWLSGSVFTFTMWEVPNLNPSCIRKGIQLKTCDKGISVTEYGAAEIEVLLHECAKLSSILLHTYFVTICILPVLFYHIENL